MSSYAFLAAALTFNALANVLIKYSMSRPVHPLLSVEGTRLAALAPYLSLPFLTGILCFALNLFCYSLALKTRELSLAYPIMVSCGYLVILLFSWFLFGERLSTFQYLGVGLMMIGLWLVVR